MNKLLKNIYQFTTKSPIIDIHTYNPYIYHQDYINQYSKAKIKDTIQPDKYQIPYQGLKKFLIDQLTKDQEMLKIPKEVLFVGRSNVGKSSLINALVGKKISKVSSKTGSTKKLIFHKLPSLDGYIVDAPGYGFAKINVHAVKLLQGMLYTYVKTSSRLCRIYQLIDIEHGIKKNDEYILNLLQKQNLNIQIILTKCDKINSNKLYDRQLFIARQLKEFKNVHPLLHTVSTKDNFGITELQSSLIDSFISYNARKLYNQEEQIIKLLQARPRPDRFDETCLTIIVEKQLIEYYKQQQMKQIQSDIVKAILDQGEFDGEQWYKLDMFYQYFCQIIKRDFPHIIHQYSNEIIDNNIQCKQLYDLIPIIQQDLIQRNQEAKMQVYNYKEEYKRILKNLSDARASEQLNEFDIDMDSKVYIEVIQATGLPFGTYMVKVQLFNVETTTDISIPTTSPVWNRQMEFQVPSPHGQIMVQIFQIDEQRHQERFVGQLQLPLFSFKDQQHSQLSYVLEDKSGVLLNTHQKIQLKVWWVHSKVALIEDHIIQVNQFKREIGEQEQIIGINQYNLNAINDTFHIRNVKQKKNLHLTQTQQQQYSQGKDWKITFQETMYSIAQCFKSSHQNSIEEWQKITMILSVSISVFTIFLVLLSRPCFQQLVIVMSIGMLIWSYENEQYWKISKVLGQLSLILCIQLLFDILWLLLDYKLWYKSHEYFMMEQQVFGNHILNYIAYYATIIYQPFNIMLAACAFNLSLKYHESMPQQQYS